MGLWPVLKCAFPLLHTHPHTLTAIPHFSYFVFLMVGYTCAYTLAGKYCQRQSSCAEPSGKTTLALKRLSQSQEQQQQQQCKRRRQSQSKRLQSHQQIHDPISYAIGEFGRWQLQLTILLALFNFPCTWHIFVLTFQGDTGGEYWCSKPQTFKDMTVATWMNISGTFEKTQVNKKIKLLFLRTSFPNEGEYCA